MTELILIFFACIAVMLFLYVFFGVYYPVFIQVKEGDPCMYFVGWNPEPGVVIKRKLFYSMVRDTLTKKVHKVPNSKIHMQ